MAYIRAGIVKAEKINFFVYILINLFYLIIYRKLIITLISYSFSRFLENFQKIKMYGDIKLKIRHAKRGNEKSLDLSGMGLSEIPVDIT